MADISNYITDLGAPGPVKSNTARQELRDLVWPRTGSSGSAADRQALASQLAAALATKQSPKVASTLCQLLSLVGTESEVPTLKLLLDDKDNREVARAALERIPGQAAVDVLIEAEKKPYGAEFKGGVINSLGMRGGDAAIAAIKRALSSTDAEVGLAAAEALSRYPEADADGLIVKDLGKVEDPRAKLRVAKARVRLAETLAHAGNKDAAKKVYESLAASDAEQAQKFAAKNALYKLAAANS